jgi:hypothetical protein
MSAVTDDKPFKCPFERCQRAYTRKSKLKEHLKLRRSYPDDNHPADSTMWDQVNELLSSISRPKGLTDEEKAERKKASALKCWNKNKEIYRDNQRKAKKEVLEQLKVFKNLIDLEELENGSINSKIQRHRLLKEIFSRPPSIDEWLRRDPSNSRLYLIDDSTFPRLVTLFFLPDRWPSSEPAHPVNEPTRILDVIPSSQYYDDLSMLLTLNSSPPIPPEIFSTLQQAWEIWQPVVSDESLQQCLVFISETEAEFRATSSQHDRLATLYKVWMDTLGKARELLVPRNLSIFELGVAFEDDLTAEQGNGTQQQAETAANNLPASTSTSRKRRMPFAENEVEKGNRNGAPAEIPVDPSLSRSNTRRTTKGL